VYRRIAFDSEETSAVFERLAEAGLVESPALLHLYQTFWHPFFRAETGPHWVGEGLAPDELLARVGRARKRSVTRVTLPEGWDSFQMAERFAGAGICAREDFLAAVFAPPPLEDDEDDVSPYASFEGRLYPASYDFRVNTRAADVVAKLVAEADKRHRATFASHAAELIRFRQSSGLNEDDVVVLASIVEKEAANQAELPLVASVFLNRLRNPAFRPSRMLQSDPTAAYGCKCDPSLNSCGHFTGKVTPAMLRDATNPFNTYRHAGLPPTPIGNPSTRAIEAVLTAPATEYFFFVSPDGGPHRFSRTLHEHEGHLR
jgi:UPF0755 protein